MLSAVAADTVIRHTDAFVRGMRAERDVVVCIKHFPGDGTQDRDQHLVLGISELSPRDWKDSLSSLRHCGHSWLRNALTRLPSTDTHTRVSIVT